MAIFKKVSPGGIMVLSRCNTSRILDGIDTPCCFAKKWTCTFSPKLCLVSMSARSFNYFNWHSQGARERFWLWILSQNFCALWSPLKPVYFECWGGPDNYVWAGCFFLYLWKIYGLSYTVHPMLFSRISLFLALYCLILSHRYGKEVPHTVIRTTSAFELYRFLVGTNYLPS